MNEQERKWMEHQVDSVMVGFPGYDEPGDEELPAQRPSLEAFPHQQELKAYLIEQGHIEFVTTKYMGGIFFNVLGSRGNLSWCCDPDCDRALVEPGISLFIDGGRVGEVALCRDCLQRHLKEGRIRLGEN